MQVYVGRLPTKVDTPARTLAGFTKVEPAPGHRRTIRVAVSRRFLSYWDESKNRWVTPVGKVPVHVGRSAADLEYAGTVTVHQRRASMMRSDRSSAPASRPLACAVALLSRRVRPPGGR
ncbi:fibronectin type III-like domain-contianing protein [Streptomyces sp. NPDC060053]|uniref:fibronectin type III-like domain-contianing protein n=1 Tax=Streptomyces sp. NPDC060053 TaxID=3347047 RepID=UPI0036C94F3A